MKRLLTGYHSNDGYKRLSRLNPHNVILLIIIMFKMLNRSIVSVHGQRYRRLAAREWQTEDIEPGVRVFLF